MSKLKSWLNSVSISFIVGSGFLLAGCSSGNYSAASSFGKALAKSYFPSTTPTPSYGTSAPIGRFPDHPRAQYCFSAELSYCMVGKWRSRLNSTSGTIEALISVASNDKNMAPARFWIITGDAGKNPSTVKILDGFVTLSTDASSDTDKSLSKESTMGQNMLTLSKTNGTSPNRYSGNYDFVNPQDSGTFSILDK